MTVTRGLVVAVFAYAVVVAATHWAVRSRRLNPFGGWARFVRRISEPVLKPLERRILRAGGSPSDAPLWLLGIALVGGLVVYALQRLQDAGARGDVPERLQGVVVGQDQVRPGRGGLERAGSCPGGLSRTAAAAQGTPAGVRGGVPP